MFDKEALQEKLSGLTPVRRGAFAAACAERMGRAHSEYVDEHGGDDETLVGVRQTLWASLANGVYPRMAKEIEACRGLIPEGDGLDPAEATSYGEHAVVATLYALEAASEGRLKEIGWAAERVYDAIAGLLMARLDVDLNSPEEVDQLERHSLLVAELRRQDADLAALAGTDDEGTLVEQLRGRAQADAAVLFGTDWDELPEE